MSHADLTRLGLVEVAELLMRRTLSARELTAAVLTKVDDEAAALNCFITIDAQSALARADELDRQLSTGEAAGPLHGIPITVKDTFPTAGLRTTAGSPILDSWIPAHDAAAVADLRRAGAVIIGKTSAYQFAFGAAHPAFGDVRNPWNPDMCCGGSSSGSAAAVAAGLGYGSLGSDAAGSVRSPGALCGVAAYKPTLDLISTAGALPAAYSMDHAGLFGRSVADVHRQLLAFPLYANRASPALCPADLRGLRVGIPMRHHGDTDVGAAPGVERAYHGALDELSRMGATIKEIDLPRLDHSQMLMVLIVSAEVNEFHLPWYLTRRHDYPAEVAALLEGSQNLPAVAYVRAQRLRQALAQRYAEAMAEVDVLATHVMPITAWPMDQAEVEIGGSAISALTAQTWHCVPFNLTGQPAISVRAGLADGLPVGLQLVGHPWRDEDLLRIALAYEQGSGNEALLGQLQSQSERKEVLA